MTISSIPSNTASAITPFNPLGRQTVGEESKDSKNSPLKPIVETTKSSRLETDPENQRDQKPSVEAVDEKESDSNSANQHSLFKGNNHDGAEQNQTSQKETGEEKRMQAQEQEEIRQLAARDREVRNHERAHAIVGGEFTGAPNYQYKKGPDGVSYAVSGEVSINTTALSNNPQTTIARAQKIRAAALAPVNPSPQDLRIATKAMQMELEARREINQRKREELIESRNVEEDKVGELKTENEAARDQELTDKQADTDNKERLATLKNAFTTTNSRLLSMSNDYLTASQSQSTPGTIISEDV